MRLRHILYLALSLSLVGCLVDAYQAPLHGMDILNKVPDVYIVGLNRNHTIERHWETTGQNLSQEPRFQHLHLMAMYIVKANATALATIRADPGVLFVETSRISRLHRGGNFLSNKTLHKKSRQSTHTDKGSENVHDALQERSVRPWHSVYSPEKGGWNQHVLASGIKLDTPVANGESYRHIESPGAGVRVYVLDSGVTGDGEDLTAHNFNNLENNQHSPYVPEHWPGGQMYDGAGHGTLVAGIIASKDRGIAEAATIISVKMITDEGYAEEAFVVQALHDVTNQHQHFRNNIPSETSKPNSFKGSIINMSWGDSTYGTEAFKTALKGAAEQGIYLVTSSGDAAQGNKGRESDMWPCLSPHVTCVGAMDNNYAAWERSFYGPPLDYYAPGVDIPCVNLTDTKAVQYESGSNFAAAHLSGAAAIFIGWRGYASGGHASGDYALPQTAEYFVRRNALEGLITGIPEGSDTPNLLVNTGIGLGSRRKSRLYPFVDAGTNTATRYEHGEFIPLTVSPRLEPRNADEASHEVSTPAVSSAPVFSTSAVGVNTVSGSASASQTPETPDAENTEGVTGYLPSPSDHPSVKGDATPVVKTITNTDLEGVNWATIATDRTPSSGPAGTPSSADHEAKLTPPPESDGNTMTNTTPSAEKCTSKSMTPSDTPNGKKCTSKSMTPSETPNGKKCTSKLTTPSETPKKFCTPKTTSSPKYCPPKSTPPSKYCPPKTTSSSKYCPPKTTTTTSACPSKSKAALIETKCEGSIIFGDCALVHMPIARKHWGSLGPVCYETGVEFGNKTSGTQTNGTDTNGAATNGTATNGTDANGTETVGTQAIGNETSGFQTSADEANLQGMQIKFNQSQAIQGATAYCAHLVQINFTLDGNTPIAPVHYVPGGAQNGGYIQLQIAFSTQTCALQHNKTFDMEPKTFMDFDENSKSICHKMYMVISTKCYTDQSFGKDYDPEYSIKGGAVAYGCYEFSAVGRPGPPPPAVSTVKRKKKRAWNDRTLGW